MIVYITKHALTQGIVELDTDTLYRYNVENGRFFGFYKNERGCMGVTISCTVGEWYTEKGMVILDAENRRYRRIESLRKQIEKIEKLTFK